jgi:hypothetical protein
MKKLLIVVDKHLQNYVANALSSKVPNLEIIHANVHEKYAAIVIEGNRMTLTSYTDFSQTVFVNWKQFNIASARIADSTIDMVVTEYNKEDYLKEFVIGGHFNRNKMSLKFFKDKTTLDGKIISTKTLSAVCDAGLDHLGEWKMGGNGIAMFTNSDKDKQYIHRNELYEIRKWMNNNDK